MTWKWEYEPNEPPVQWQCAVCESPAGMPHKDGCKCTLYEGVPIEDEEWPSTITDSASERLVSENVE